MMLTFSILESLQKLEENPSDKNEIEKLLNYADIIIGDAKFLDDKELEESAKTIVSLFQRDKEAQEKSVEINRLLEHVRKLVRQHL